MTAPIPRAAVVAGLGSALALALRAPIDVGPRDAGELGAAAATLGVSHPTGAPFAMAIGHAASLVPIGTVAFRQSRALVALAVAVIVAAPTLLRAGTMMEVYAPSLMLIALAWVAAERRALGWLGALSGLALSAHVTARVLVPLIALAPLAREVLAARSGRPLARPIVAGLALAPLILEVPAAALRRPALGWGDPSTPTAFLRHFLASDIRESFAGRTTASHRLEDARALLDLVILDAPLPTLALAAIGAVIAIRALARARELGLAIVAASAALDLSYSLLVNPMGIIDRQVGHVALLGLAALAGAAIDLLAARSPARLAPLVAGAAALATLVGAQPRLAPELAGSEARFVAETWTVPGALARVPPRALVICEADDLCGGALYAQLVEGARPDVTVIPRPFLQAPTHLAHRLAGAPTAIDEALSKGGRALLVDAGGEHPYGFALQLDAATPLVRAVTPDLPPTPPEAPLVAGASRLLALDHSLCGASLDACTPLTRRLLAQAHLGPLAPLMGARRATAAEALAAAAIALHPTMAAAWNDRAVARGELGRFDEALADLDRAIELEPRRPNALGNRVLYLAVLGRIPEAREAQATMRARCGGCLLARLYGEALDVREGASTSRLDALREESERHGKRDAWCRVYGVVARVEPPPRCRPGH